MSPAWSPIVNPGSVPVFNVKDFGATGDNIHDDTAAFRAAITAAEAAGGGTIYLPPGAYKVTDTIGGPTVAPITLGDNIALAGEGQGISVIAPAFSASPPNRVIDNDWTDGNVNITLRDFTLDRSGANVQHGILLNGVTDLLVENIEVMGTPSVMSGALAVSGVGPSVRLLSTNVRLCGCRFHSTDNYGVQLSFVLNATVTGCTFDDCYREAVGVEPEAGCSAENVSIVGNTFTTGTVPGDASSATGVVIVTTTSGGTIDGVTITGNTILNTATVNGNINPGIDVLGGNEVSVTGNILIGLNGAGISIGNASVLTEGVTIMGNIVRNCGAGQGGTFNQVGINLRQAIQTVIVGNYVRGSHHVAGVMETSSASSNVIIGNQLLDGTPVQLLAGSHTATRLNYTKRLAASLYIETAVSYTLTGSEEIVGVTDTSSARTITLPAANAVSAGRVFVIKDESGGAATHNITITPAGADTIDGAASLVISANYGEARIYSNGSAGWFTS